MRLLVGDAQRYPGFSRRLGPGVHGRSNDLLDSRAPAAALDPGG